MRETVGSSWRRVDCGSWTPRCTDSSSRCIQFRWWSRETRSATDCPHNALLIRKLQHTHRISIIISITIATFLKTYTLYSQSSRSFPVAAARAWNLYRNTFGTRLLFPSSAENSRPFCSGRRSLMRSDNVLCFICAPVAQSLRAEWLFSTYRRYINKCIYLSIYLSI